MRSCSLSTWWWRPETRTETGPARSLCQPAGRPYSSEHISLFPFLAVATSYLVVPTALRQDGTRHRHVGVVVVPLRLDVVVPHVHLHGVVESEAGVGLSALRRRLGNLPVVPENVTDDLRPISLVDHQAVDAVVEGFVVVEPHTPVEILVLVSCDVHA